MKDGKELLKVFDLNGSLIKFETRKKYYDEIKKEYDEKGSVNSQIQTIRLILMNSEGKVILQKRSKIKSINSGLYNKTVGGHITKDYSKDLTVVKECSEELGFPATVVPQDQFKNAVTSIDLSIIGIFREIDYIPNFESIRIFKNKEHIIQPQMTYIYIGYYNGAIKFIDGESSGIEVFTHKELEEELKNNPEKYTEDLQFMFKRYKKYLIPLKELLEQN
jgi:isopentenyldiphosphate isomerase